MTNQAWRKKPRNFAPKSRLGCKTCKIRRVKCDLTRPSCLKCQSTGRTCDGYAELAAQPPNTRTSPDHHHLKPNNFNYSQPHTSLTTLSLTPLIILPVADPTQTAAMYFFEYVSVQNLDKYRRYESWSNIIMLFSQTVPAVRHAALALASVHRNHLDWMQQFRPGVTLDQLALFHYHRAIHHLLDYQANDTVDKTAIILLVCYLLICFDQLAGNYVQAIIHLRGGVELSRNIEKPDRSPISQSQTLLSQITGQIHRLDMQAVAFLVDWIPADIQETTITKLSITNGFSSLDQAADCIQTLFPQVMELYYTKTEQYLSPETILVKGTLIGQLDKWLCLFENMHHNDVESEPSPLPLLLRLHHMILWILLHSHGPNRELNYDNFVFQFQYCLTLVKRIVAVHENNDSAFQEPSFTPEVGIIPVLYIIGIKCRDSKVRRHILDILRQRPMREAIWDSISAARIVERIIEIEEAGLEAQSISMLKRIETISWLQSRIGQSGIKVDLNYTFCGQERMYEEVLTC